MRACACVCMCVSVCERICVRAFKCMHVFNVPPWNIVVRELLGKSLYMSTHLIMCVLLCMRVLNGNAYEKVLNVFCSGLQLALVDRL